MNFNTSPLLVGPKQWRRKMFWDRGCHALRGIFFLDLLFSCAETALIASSYCFEGQALTYYMSNHVNLLIMDAPAATFRLACEINYAQERVFNARNTYRKIRKYLPRTDSRRFAGQRRNPYVSAPSQLTSVQYR